MSGGGPICSAFVIGCYGERWSRLHEVENAAALFQDALPAVQPLDEALRKDAETGHTSARQPLDRVAATGHHDRHVTLKVDHCCDSLRITDRHLEYGNLKWLANPSRGGGCYHGSA
jgi:hypothetical protein